MKGEVALKKTLKKAMKSIGTTAQEELAVMGKEQE